MNRLLLALPLAALASGALAAVRPNGERLDGEYGLWVRWRGDSIAVSWVTRDTAPGFLKVTAGGRTRIDETSARARAHTIVFADPKAGDLTLQYGSRGDATDAHTTVIRESRPAGPARVSWPAADSIVVVSDIHGEFERLTKVLRSAGVIDEKLVWAGGHKQLVIAGDVFDRGPDATRALWFLYGLDAQAERAGGRLHMILGNHEIMVMTADLRYLSARDTALANLYGTTFDRLYDPRNSVLGRWLVEKPALTRIGDVLFAHGGVSSDYLGWTLKAYADSLHAYTHEELFDRWADTTYVTPLDSAGIARRNEFFWGERSVFWYRDYMLSDSTARDLQSVLEHFDASLAVIGHTPLNTGITQRFGGRLIDVNTFPFITEALLLVRERSGWARYRIRESGAIERLR